MASTRSNVLHYQKNNQAINQDDAIMLDAGCLFKQYSSDITRFWPINGTLTLLDTCLATSIILLSGRFSSVYRQLYEILLTVQKNLLGHINADPRSITRAQLNTLADQYMIQYLREERILSRTCDDHEARHIVNYLCPTSVSHHLGLDVHDCELIPSSEALQPGNVITIEPGTSLAWML